MEGIMTTRIFWACLLLLLGTNLAHARRGRVYVSTPPPRIAPLDLIVENHFFSQSLQNSGAGTVKVGQIAVRNLTPRGWLQALTFQKPVETCYLWIKRSVVNEAPRYLIALSTMEKEADRTASNTLTVDVFTAQIVKKLMTDEIHVEAPSSYFGDHDSFRFFLNDRGAIEKVVGVRLKPNSKVRWQLECSLVGPKESKFSTLYKK
jgi:hypothetical protein